MAATFKDVIEFIRNPQLSSTERSLIISTLNEQTRVKRVQAKAQFRVGQPVMFYSERLCRNVTGTIRKINRINIDLIEAGSGAKWRVSPQLLRTA